jgi:hypothetical protein
MYVHGVPTTVKKITKGYFYHLITIHEPLLNGVIKTIKKPL